MWRKGGCSNGSILWTEDPEQREEPQDREGMETGRCPFPLEEKDGRMAEGRLMQKRKGRNYGNEDRGIHECSST